MIRTICESLRFPEEATDTFVSGYKKICESGYEPQLASAKKPFFDKDTKAYREILKDVSEGSGVHKYTVDMIFLLCCVDTARRIFAEKGISKDICQATLLDITEKLDECKRLYGVWGTFVIWWYPEFFRAERFWLGRLQFETQEFPFENYKGIIGRGDTVYNFHVPASGPLTYDAIIEAFKEAYNFFGISGVMPIYFHSWLIYPPHAELFPDGSNLKRFYELFDVISQHEYKTNAELWRVFYVPYSDGMDYSALAEDTSLRRSFKKFLMDGKKIGAGVGIILFDGEKIINP